MPAEEERSMGIFYTSFVFIVTLVMLTLVFLVFLEKSSHEVTLVSKNYERCQLKLEQCDRDIDNLEQFMEKNTTLPLEEFRKFLTYQDNVPVNSGGIIPPPFVIIAFMATIV